MFTTLIVQPIFNVLVLIYNLIPGHNFGLAIILFTIVVRMALWPLLKKQLHQTKLMRKMQPELKRIKADAKGDRQKEALMMMELYKERGVKPLRSIGLILLQAPILIGLYLGLTRIVKDPHELVNFSYPFIQNFDWMKQLAANIGKFDETLFGAIDLTQAAVSAKGVYWPAMILVVGSAVVQYLQSRQLLPKTEDGRSLRKIMQDAGEGKTADQAEVSAIVSRNMTYLIPAMVFLFTVQLACALSLYWLVGGIVALIQQTIVLRDDTEEMEKIADEPRSTRSNTAQREQRLKNAVEAEIVKTTDVTPAARTSNETPSKKSKKSGKKSKKRRR